MVGLTHIILYFTSLASYPIQAVRQSFFKEFFFLNINQVLFPQEATRPAGSSVSFDYLNLFWRYYQPWTVLILLLIALLIVCLLLFKFNQHIKSFKTRAVLAPLFGALFILLFFSCTRTHFSTYTFPAMPLLAIFIAISFYKIFKYFKLEKLTIILLVPLLFIGYFFNLKTTKQLIQPYHYEEREVGLIFKNKNKQNYPLYVINWPFLETIRYYADTQEINLDIFTNGGETLKAPSYILINASALASPYFYDSQGKFLTDYEGINAIYQGTFLFLVYSERDITLPVISQ